MAGLLQDLRFALRQLRKNPGYTLTAAAMLAVAICANSTVFSWINGTMLHPIAGARDAGSLVSVLRGEWNVSPAPPLSYLDYRDMRERNHSFTGLLAYNHDWITLTGGAMPERIYVANVTANYFDVLGVKPLMGRFFLPEEETRPDAVPYVILSHSLWQTRYDGNPAIVGKTISIARHPVTVLGVAPEGFIGAMPGIRQDAWLPLNPIGSAEYQLTHRNAAHYNVLGRLRQGVSREQAALDLDTIMKQIVAAYPDQHPGVNTILLDPMWRSPFGANGYMAAMLPILLAIAAAVLLLTCANVTTLTLVRFVSRRKEVAIRQSLGAGRVRLVRQMVIEGAVVALGAGLVALLLTAWTSKSLMRFIPPNSNPIVIHTAMDSYVVLAIALLAAVCGLLCGALPAWRSSQVPAAEVLKEESGAVTGGSHNRRLLSGLVVGQISLSFALLVSSMLFLRTLGNIAASDPGFEQDHILTAAVGLNIAGYPDEQAQEIRHRILARLETLPGVTAASLTDWLPMSFTRKTTNAYPEGYAPQPHETLEVRRAEVSSRYFEMLGIPILEGRSFTPDDNQKSPNVVIVDQTAAHRYWPGQDPIGKKLRIWNHSYTVVGVAKNSKHAFMSERPEPMIYMSYFQDADNETIVQVKTQGDPDDVAPMVERAIHEIDGQVPVFDVRSMRESTQLARLFVIIESTFAGVFAVIALILAATGIYGVVAYRTQLRTHEIGIRVALGASRTDVLRLVLGQGTGLTGIGLGLGVALSYALTRFIDGMLYGVRANDPLTMIAVLLLLGGISLLACYLPARRAMYADPVTAIRGQ